MTVHTKRVSSYNYSLVARFIVRISLEALTCSLLVAVSFTAYTS